jgi:TRAP transporter TAXI family solute receptor
MALYGDVWQVVVRKDASVRDLEDLRGKRIFVGADRSGTKWGATRVLRVGAGLSEADYHRVNVHSYSAAARELESGRAQAAFFITATPATAISEVLASGCCRLLDLQEHVEPLAASIPGLSLRHIPPHIYENQPDAVHTLGSNAILVSRAGLPDKVVIDLLNALYDHLGDLAVAHIRVQEVRFNRAFTNLPPGVDLHPGAVEFQAREKQKLQIATGVIGGKYYGLGKRIQLVFEKEGIPSRAIHTDGSLENLRLLEANEQPTIAIVQYDTALASIWSPALYLSPGLEDSLGIPRIRDLRRLATLHDESLHVLVRRSAIPPRMRKRPTLRALHKLRVCLGSENSGTQVMARVLLDRHAARPREQLLLSVPDMVARLHGGEIDAGFFMSHIPSEALKSIVHDDRNRMLSIDVSHVSAILGPALSLSRVESGTYGAQRKDEPAIETISTQAVLVARSDLPFEVRRLTKAVFESAAFLGVDEGPAMMARSLPSLPLHPEAEVYYRSAGYLPSPPSIDWLTVTWRSLAIIVMLAAGYQGMLRIRRDRTTNDLARMILRLPVGHTTTDSVQRLVEVRDSELGDRVQRQWWQSGELDKGRWRYLHDLTNERIKEAKENLTAGLAEELRKLASDRRLDTPEGQETLRKIEARVWAYFQKGELDASHQALLLEVLERLLRPSPSPEAKWLEEIAPGSQHGDRRERDWNQSHEGTGEVVPED